MRKSKDNKIERKKLNLINKKLKIKKRKDKRDKLQKEKEELN